MKTLVVSDLHVGPDHVPPIYAGGDALPQLIRQHAQQPLRVVLNGDTFDLLLDDDPLALDAETAAERIRACAQSVDGAPLLAALADVLGGGGELLIRAGNHDLELALPQVQAALREVIARTGAPLERVTFADDDEPYRFDDGPLRVLIAHGENNDAFNRWTRAELAGDFKYPPGSTLVKEILNPLKQELRFIDLLKPDFQGAVLGALAVKPSAVRTLLKLSTLDIITEAVARSFDESPYASAEPGPFAQHLAAAKLEAEETDELLAFLEDTDGAYTDGVPLADRGILGRGLSKLGRASLTAYAAAHRVFAGAAGEQFFADEPEGSEWTEAARLRDKYGVNVVVCGHTHARRFGTREGVTYANTGTWIVLMQLPPRDASLAEWSGFLDELAADPALAKSSRTRMIGSACLIDGANPDERKRVQLVGAVSSPPASWHARSAAATRGAASAQAARSG